MCSGGVHQFSAGSFPYTACDWQNTVFFLNIFQFSKRHRCVMCDTDWCPVPTQCSSGICCIDCWRMHPPQIRPVGVIAIVCCCFPRWTPAYSPTVGAPAHLLQRFAAVPLSIELTCPGCTPLSLFAASPLACIFPHASKFFHFFQMQHACHRSRAQKWSLIKPSHVPNNTERPCQSARRSSDGCQSACVDPPCRGGSQSLTSTPSGRQSSTFSSGCDELEQLSSPSSTASSTQAQTASPFARPPKLCYGRPQDAQNGHFAAVIISPFLGGGLVGVTTTTVFLLSSNSNSPHQCRKTWSLKAFGLSWAVYTQPFTCRPLGMPEGKTRGRESHFHAPPRLENAQNRLVLPFLFQNRCVILCCFCAFPQAKQQFFHPSDCCTTPEILQGPLQLRHGFG